MYLTDKLKVCKNSLADGKFSFYIYDKSREKYITEYFELFNDKSGSTKVNPHWFYKDTITTKATYLVACIPENKEIWAKINNKILALDNILNNTI